MEEIKGNFERQKRIAEEIRSLSEELRNTRNEEEREMIASQIESLKRYLVKSGQNVIEAAEKISVPKPLTTSPIITQVNVQSKPITSKYEEEKAEERRGYSTIKKDRISALEKMSLKRMKKKEVKVVKKKEKKANIFAKLASSLFLQRAMGLIKDGKFYNLRRDLTRANLEFIPANYVAMIFFSTLVSIFVGTIITIFFLFFSVVASPPFIVPVEEGMLLRLAKVFWILFAVPGAVFLFAYFYPSMERKSLETRINHELPFATIHMSSISNSMIEPSKIFSIIISTEEYPNLEKEFIKLLNQVNIYGYDLVTALREMAFNSPSRKLADLYNGLATTINSGGDLPEFFDKRAQTLLFDHRLEVEKAGKAAETFMDIYISVVIAAPMILMLLLMMMRISGLGISLSTGTITLVMVLGVSLLNILFIAFLQLKQPEGTG